MSSTHIIVDPTLSVPEPILTLSDSIFNGWFGIPFQDNFSSTHIRSHYPLEILTLYGLIDLIPFYPTILSSAQIKSLVLRILPLQFMHHINHIFLSHIVSPVILSPHATQYIINFFTLQLLPIKDQ